MKKLWIVLLSLFLLTGCGQKPETPVPPSDPSPTQQEPNEPPANTEPETPARAEQVDLTFFVEGEEEALPATLYVGDGYSLYIPDGTGTARSSPRRTASRQTPGSVPSTAMWRCLYPAMGI